MFASREINATQDLASYCEPAFRLNAKFLGVILQFYGNLKSTMHLASSKPHIRWRDANIYSLLLNF
jgi:hypothetical protein